VGRRTCCRVRLPWVRTVGGVRAWLVPVGRLRFRGLCARGAGAATPCVAAWKLVRRYGGRSHTPVNASVGLIPSPLTPELSHPTRARRCIFRARFLSKAVRGYAGGAGRAAETETCRSIIRGELRSSTSGGDGTGDPALPAVARTDRGIGRGLPFEEDAAGEGSHAGSPCGASPRGSTWCGGLRRRTHGDVSAARPPCATPARSARSSSSLGRSGSDARSPSSRPVWSCSWRRRCRTP